MRSAAYLVSILGLCFLACEAPSSTSHWRAAAPDNGHFALRYPSEVLDASTDSVGVRLHRKVDGPTRNPFCDFKGTAEPTSHIVDFDYRITLRQVPDSAALARGDHPWRAGEIALGGHRGVEDLIGTGGCGPRVITLFLDQHHVLEIRGIRLAELRALASKGILAQSSAFRAGEVDSLLGLIVSTVDVRR